MIVYAQGWKEKSRQSGWTLHTSIENRDRYISKYSESQYKNFDARTPFGPVHKCSIEGEDIGEDLFAKFLTDGVVIVDDNNPRWLARVQEF